VYIKSGNIVTDHLYLMRVLALDRGYARFFWLTAILPMRWKHNDCMTSFFPNNQ